jgi:hypothetical protein
LRVERAEECDDGEWEVRIRVEVEDQDGRRRHLDDVEVVARWSGAYNATVSGTTRDGRVRFETPEMGCEPVTLAVLDLGDDDHEYAPGLNRQTSITIEPEFD